MIKARGIISVAVALGLALLITRLVSNFFEAAEPETARIVVAAADIELGEVLTDENLKRSEWPAARMPKGTFKSIDDLVGRTAADAIFEGEPVFESRLVSLEGGPVTGISGRIDPGMRAVSIEIDDVSGVSGMLRAGDRVDVIAASKATGKNKKEHISRVILTRVSVLAVSSGKESGGKGRAARKGTATLLLRPDEAAILAASEGARLTLARRNPGDEVEGDTEATIFSAALGPKTTSELDRMAEERNKRLQAAIKKGMRAVTIRVNDEDGICGHLQPGNRVDVVGTHPFIGVAYQGERVPGAKGIVTGGFQVSRILMQDIEVLFIEEDTELAAPSGRKSGEGSEPDGPDAGNEKGNEKNSGGEWIAPWPTKRVTLLVSVEDVERLTVIALTSKGVKLIVRKYGDEGIALTEGEKSNEIFYGGEERYYGIEIFGRGPSRRSKRFERDDMETEPLNPTRGGTPNPGI